MGPGSVVDRFGSDDLSPNTFSWIQIGAGAIGSGQVGSDLI